MRKIFIVLLTAALLMFTACSYAADPTSEIPPNHWAYDAIKQLTARGILSGYPEGSFRGKAGATRDELSAVLASAMYSIDLEKAGREDFALLNRLITEFNDELAALGVKPKEIDARLSAVEDRLGGWRISGELEMDMKFTGNNEEYGFHGYGAFLRGDSGVDAKHFRLNFNRHFDDDTQVFIRFSNTYGDLTQDIMVDRFYATMKLPYGFTLMAGRQELAWESGLGLLWDNDPYYGNIESELFVLSRSWRALDLRVAAGSYQHDIWSARYRHGVENDFLFAGNVGFQFDEKFRAGLLGYMLKENGLSLPGETVIKEPSIKGDYDVSTYGAYAGYKITPNIDLKGVHYWQKHGSDIAEVYSGAAPGGMGYDDSATAWKVMLDIGHDVLKFTSIWLEYGQIDNNFMFGDYAHPYGPYGADVLFNRPGADRYRPIYSGSTSTVWGIFANQWWWWNGLWHTFQRYVYADFDAPGLDNAVNWSLGIGYRINPSVEFELSYHNVDFGENNPLGFDNGKDHLVQFRTTIAF